ncbi:unnamed protein product [Polarella glacialis]|uniref:Glycoside hydrolase family 5 domain-containing protein n=1 Tax=Polarella glacialis TaxID=89957 RepID=A0A813K625_POLGL|nr:unnamed protein product [Polarella glacialis]CAE8698087.1 unnamed protein product [Polarella glacialis]
MVSLRRSLLTAAFFFGSTLPTMQVGAMKSCSGESCPAQGLRQQDHVLLQFNHGLSKAPSPSAPPEGSAEVPPAPQKLTSGYEAPEGSVVAKHGQLRVQGNSMVDEHGQPVRLRGMSLFWSQWMPKFWSEDTVRWLKDDWHVTLVRAAMAVESGGYLESPATELAKMEAVVQAAIDIGIYVVVDWHDHNAEQHVPQAKEFFKHMAEKYGHYPNVMFEIFNEPVRQSWLETIKPYHETMVPVIRQYSENIIILGTRLWSQEVDVASEHPVDGTDLAYTLHFYANSHRQELRDKVKKALENGIAIFATEWGTCDASGDGGLDFAETQTWLKFFEEHNISDANWAVGDKAEACSALLPGASGSGAWATCELTASGAFVRSSLRAELQAHTAPEPCPQLRAPPPGLCSNSNEDCSKTGCCSDVGSRCFVKNDWWASCRASCTPGIDFNDPPAFRSPWSCKELKRSVNRITSFPADADAEAAAAVQPGPYKRTFDTEGRVETA